jgi:predicted RNase H-like nuclease
VTRDAEHVGIAWAAESWIAAAFGDGTFVDAAVAEEVGELWGRYGETASTILVGVPIGLVGAVDTEVAPPSRQQTAESADDPDRLADPERCCDVLARECLGERADAIVTPPSREATRRRRFPAARRVHERTTGGDLSRKAFDLAPAIAAVDELLQEVPESRPVVRGSHPELAFRAFAGEPLAYDPRTAGGHAERMRILADHDRDAPPTVQSAAEAVAGARVPIHAVLDALVLAYTARPGVGSLRSLPPDPPTDPTGLPVELVYRAEDPL